MEVKNVLEPIMEMLSPAPEFEERIKKAVFHAIRDNQTNEIGINPSGDYIITPAFIDRVWIYAGRPKKLSIAPKYAAMVKH